MNWDEAPLIYGYKLGAYLAKQKKQFWSNWELDMGPRCPCFAVTKGQIKSLKYTVPRGSGVQAYGCWLFPTSERIKVIQ